MTEMTMMILRRRALITITIMRREKMTLMIWCEREVRTWKEVAFEDVPPSVVIAQNSTSSRELLILLCSF